MRDCLFLVADKNMAFALRGLLGRNGWNEAVGCSPIAVDVKQDIVIAAGFNDPGLYTRANVLLEGYRATHARVMVFLDAEWNGSPGADGIKGRVMEHIQSAGWKTEEGCCIVFDPEVDRVIWTLSPHTATALGWPDMDVLRSWLAGQGHWPQDAVKPPRPKEALEKSLREKQKPRSSALYQDVCGKVSIRKCSDEAVKEFCTVLSTWFPSHAP